MNRTEELCADEKKCTFELTDRTFREDFNRKVDELLNFQYNIITKLDVVLARLAKLVV
jgi:hypothetical protein